MKSICTENSCWECNSFWVNIWVELSHIKLLKAAIMLLWTALLAEALPILTFLRIWSIQALLTWRRHHCILTAEAKTPVVAACSAAETSIVIFFKQGSCWSGPRFLINLKKHAIGIIEWSLVQKKSTGLPLPVMECLYNITLAMLDTRCVASRQNNSAWTSCCLLPWRSKAKCIALFKILSNIGKATLLLLKIFRPMLDWYFLFNVLFIW